jgi:hypothetical protein
MPGVQQHDSRSTSYYPNVMSLLAGIMSSAPPHACVLCMQHLLLQTGCLSSVHLALQHVEQGSADCSEGA